MTASTKQNKTFSGSLAIVVVTALLAIISVVIWVVQLSNGMGATALNNIDVWGLYIAGLVFFMGLSAGSLVLAALPVILDMDAFRKLGNAMAFAALASLISGGLFILVDIGKPERLWRLVSFANLGSPLLWDVLLTVVYLIVATVFLRQLLSKRTTAELKTIAWVALLAGVADGITALVFATQVAHEIWYSAVQPMAFFFGALASAGCLALVMVFVLKAAGKATPDVKQLKPLAWLTVISLALGILLAGSELVTLAFTRSVEALKIVNFLLTSPMYWVEIVCAVLAILILVIPALNSKGAWVVSAGIIGLVSLLAKRLVFVTSGFALPNLTYPGVKIAPAAAYVPNVMEWGLAIGLVGLFVLLMTIGYRALSLGQEN